MLTPEERHQKELIDGLRADIRTLTHALDEHAQIFKSSEPGRNASHQQAEEAHIRAVVLEQIQAQRETDEANGKNKKWTNFEKWYFAVQFLLFIATASAFGAAMWYASIAAQQRTEMHATLLEIQKQTPKIEVSASAAKEAADTQLAEMKGLNSAILYFSVGFQNDAEDFFVRLNIDNTGHMLAKKTTGVTTVKILGLPAGKQVGPDIVFRFPPETIPILTRDLPLNIYRDYGNAAFNADLWRSIQAFQRAIRIEYAFSYYDGFDTVSKSSCSMFMATEFTSRDPVRKQGPFGRMSMFDCGDFYLRLTKAIASKALVDKEAAEQIQRENEKAESTPGR